MEPGPPGAVGVGPVDLVSPGARLEGARVAFGLEAVIFIASPDARNVPLTATIHLRVVVVVVVVAVAVAVAVAEAAAAVAVAA